MSGFSPRVKAVLGPTNTGKTHLAIERLLGHSSGIIGFPLRLLARENYDRMVLRKGIKNVALITGEEKIVPPDAKYFSCTVEAMPLDRRVEFVAVDEIQLCADPDRGHIFTDRLLHARGMVETMFLGAETIRRLLKRLVPEAEIETRPRLSELSYAGPVKLSKLPPRSAIVAFSGAEVYAIAEAVRRKRGGCAVVMGRLSPRTRNAQVALYQEKEVDFLVATDAIGMGLNMDVDHVAFAGLSKFDGHRPRLLMAPEVAQIAGRAGRGMRDGTFGVTANCPPLADELVKAVEAHAFEPLEQLFWRNSSLDFCSIDFLLQSLTASAPAPGLVKGNDATDVETLAALSLDPEIRKLAQGRSATRLLWEACQIPDFRKLATDQHAKLCARVFTHLRRDIVLPPAWIGAEFEMLDKTEGDIDTLMQRLADVRVWAYITARADWMRDAAPWANRAREIEDKISDTLHEKLMARFVDRRAAHLTRRLEALETPGADELLSAVSARGVVLVEGHEVGHIEGFNFYPDPAAQGPEKKFLLRAARRALGREMPRRILRAELAADSAFSIAGQRIIWEGAAIARLRKGASLLRPAIEILPSEFLDGAARERLRLRLAGYITAEIGSCLAPLFQLMADPKPEFRGLIHRLSEAVGVLPGAENQPSLRAALKPLGIEAGQFAVFLPALLKPKAAGMRALLWGLWHNSELPALPAAGLVCAPAWDDAAAALAMGWVKAGPVMLRLDIAEKMGRELNYLIRKHPVALPAGLSSRMSLKPEQLPAVLNRLGFRIIPSATLAAQNYGPPAPPMLARRKAVKPVAVKPMVESPPPLPDNPFAALAALRHGAPRPVAPRRAAPRRVAPRRAAARRGAS